VFAQCWVGVVVDSYIDDFLIVDVENSPLKDREKGRTWASSAQYFLNHIHTLLGMEFDPSKDKTTTPTNVILGVEVHLQDFLRECKVSFSPTKTRCVEILHQLRVCERWGISVLVRLGFILTVSYRSLIEIRLRNRVEVLRKQISFGQSL
jgi:hypothetical protein